MFVKSFDMQGLAHTLSADEVSLVTDGSFTGPSSRTHADGWTISGYVREDWYVWVNEFEAHHPVFGRVWGDFEHQVFADTQDGYEAFYASHTPEEWDYQDI